MPSLIVHGERVVLPDGIRPAAIHIRDGRIAAITSRADRPAGADAIDAGELVVMPGLVDTHVHINDPGRADWEGFDHATRAAAAGGVTTLVDMPLNSVPSTTGVEALEAKLRASMGRCHVDVGFWGGVVPGNAADLVPLAARGVLGFKCFLSPSGVDEFQHVSVMDLTAAMPVLAALQLPLLVHAELPELLLPPDTRMNARDYSTWLHSRPPRSESGAIDLMISLARDHATPVHIVHLASADALPMIRLARAEGVALTVETCPHYLTFDAEDIPAGATAFKCAPPIRDRDNRERLWRGLVDGAIDLIATDHSPAPAALKHLDDGDFLQAWGGIASLQLGLAAVWEGAASRDIALEHVSRWMSSAPAALAGLAAIKGSLTAGHDADLVIWDPDASVVVTPAALHHRHHATPYAGMRLRGRIHKTLLRGQVVFDDGIFADVPAGRPILGSKC
jgi:allantoinase